MPEYILDALCEKYTNLIFSQNIFEGQSRGFLDQNSFFSFIVAKRETIIPLLEQRDLQNYWIQKLKKSFISKIFDYNQYINLPIDYAEKVKKLYLNFANNLLAILKKDLGPEQTFQLLSVLTKEHYKSLLETVSWLNKIVNEDNYNKNIIDTSVVCKEYSANFQIAFLAIDITDLKQPILDLGCGSDANLVKYFINRGYDTFGLDRNLAMTDKHLIPTDWFNFTFKKNFWGTIISHMAFSNHFIFNHHYIHGKPELYARCYMSILSSLKPNASFYYSPGTSVYRRASS